MKSFQPVIVYVGRKPLMSYVQAVMRGFAKPDTGEVILKARGRAISTAVDAAEIVRHRFFEKLKISEIKIGSEEVSLREGGTRMVSTIKIKLTP